MTTPAAHADARDGLTLLLGPRQAEIMGLLWTHGQATARQVQQWLTKDSDLAYDTVATLCLRLVEKGLLRQRMEESDRRDRRVVSYIYTPRISEADFVRAAVEHQLDHLLALYPEYVTRHAQREGAGGSGEDADDRANVERVLANLAPPRDADGQRASDAAVDSGDGKDSRQMGHIEPCRCSGFPRTQDWCEHACQPAWASGSLASVGAAGGAGGLTTGVS